MSRKSRHGKGVHTGVNGIVYTVVTDYVLAEAGAYRQWQAEHLTRFPEPTVCAVCGKTALYRDYGPHRAPRGYCRSHKGLARNGY